MAIWKTVISTPLITFVACAVLHSVPAAQPPPRFAITEARLAEALAEVREDRAPVLADILTLRIQRVDLRTPTGDGVFVGVKDYFAC
jgi:hypothetical protein